MQPTILHKGNLDNWLNLWHALDRICPKGILCVQCMHQMTNSFWKVSSESGTLDQCSSEYSWGFCKLPEKYIVLLHTSNYLVACCITASRIDSRCEYSVVDFMTVFLNRIPCLTRSCWLDIYIRLNLVDILWIMSPYLNMQLPIVLKYLRNGMLCWS